MIEATNLPDTDTAFFNISGKDFTDPFAVLDVGTARVLKTKYINNELNPKWDEKFDIYVCHQASAVTFKVRIDRRIHLILSLAQCTVRTFFI